MILHNLQACSSEGPSCVPYALLPARDSAWAAAAAAELLVVQQRLHALAARAAAAAVLVQLA
jgi:hypothetical protein